MHVAFEAKSGKMVEQARAKSAAPRQPIDLLGREMKVFEKGESLFKPRRNQEASSGRKIADEELENRSLCLSMFQVRLDHIELVKVGQQRTSSVVHSDTFALRSSYPGFGFVTRQTVVRN